jgi:hypothetical protein
MNCFYHPTVAAVGTCKSCCKGLCPGCAADVGKGLACKSSCEDDVKGLVHLSNYSIALVDSKKGNQRGNTLMGGMFYVAIGVIFTSLAVLVHDGVSLLLALPMGLIFLGMGARTIQRARTLPK